MEHTVKFEGVSKKYQLGLTRTSLPALVSNGVRGMFGREPVSATSRDFWALNDVSFKLSKGESLALVGRNGAGKTTILKLLANISKPTTGTVELNGQLSALIELGAGFHPDLTGRENIFLNGAILGLSRKEIDGRFDEIVDFSELEQFIDTPVKRYSSGMTVRLGFAVASCIEPDILLVDEVLAVGDASFQQKCLRRIQTLLDNGASIIFVSHNFYLVQSVCEKALYLEHGEMRLSGPTQEVLDVYEQDLHQERARKLEVEEQRQTVSAEESTVEITHVDVLGEDTNGDDRTFHSHEPVQIRIHYNAYQPLNKAHVSVFIVRSDGLTCCMLRTKVDAYDLDVERGQGVVTVTLQPLQLISGTYFVEAWFLDATDSMVISPNSGRSDWFDVKGAAFSYDNDSGVFEPRTYWEHAASNGRSPTDDHKLSPSQIVLDGNY